MTMTRTPGGFSRRTILRTAACAGGLLPALGGPARAQTKLSHEVAKYQDHPNGQQRCEICLQFKPPASCAIVADSISPQGWCQFFAARENAR